MANRELPSVSELRNLIRYNPDTGYAYWLHLSRDSDAVKQPTVWNKQRAGTRAGTYIDPNGYAIISVAGHKLLMHRLVWALHYGIWPTKQIDHINGNPSDNRIKNLRDVSHSLNMRNKKRHRNNTTGHVGVYKTGNGTYYAQISYGRKTKHLGVHPDIDSAIRARRDAEVGRGFTKRHGA